MTSVNRAGTNDILKGPIMPSDGKRLESLVKTIEEYFMGEGFTIEQSKKIFDSDGSPVAEFDIFVSGRFGSTEMTWLLECRDRPSHGPAPSAWIEQLIGRRTRFNFGKVTAVSTTGFAPAAVALAEGHGIELRVLARKQVDDVESWLSMKAITQITRSYDLKSAILHPAPGQTAETLAALGESMNQANGATAFLRSVRHGVSTTPANAFVHVASSIESLHEGLAPGAGPRRTQLNAEYPEDDRYVIDTNLGPIQIARIEFIGTVRIEATSLPVHEVSTYSRLGAELPISEIVSFSPMEAEGRQISLELHRVQETGETLVLARVVK
ncbi:MAG: hypothetical protein CL858_04945 [Cupriavidus sp.]|uniref:hypothetical protein n=1 Tax=Cupriavidus TaxID=106589 RepID=UPI000C5EFD8C|nr:MULTISPECIES: hypothetical protein [Cupriavidus]MBU64797.1 hypothetical protein [Cupriavidus sp.]KAB0600375.1 hypothetical protein F7R19_21445 [Cupriavidus pauculus]KAI3593453.1 hypothetical protein D9X30_1605 [Cupriavidus sp. U2]MBY4733458.1 hypothetical protein [Cupriavidus pauculus]UAL03805.1 hypothetical protein K8O84_28170 [Cupriavidus pauculus]